MAKRTKKGSPKTLGEDEINEAREKGLDSFEHTERIADAEAADIADGVTSMDEASAVARQTLLDSENLECVEADIRMPGARLGWDTKKAGYAAAGAAALAFAFVLGRLSARR